VCLIRKKTKPAGPMLWCLVIDLARTFSGQPRIEGTTSTWMPERSVPRVMPASLFSFPNSQQMWDADGMDGRRAVRGGTYTRYGGARLKPGVRFEAGRKPAMNTISRRLEQQLSEDNKGWGAVVVPWHADLGKRCAARRAGVRWERLAFVLLMASVNVAKLTLARTLGAQ